MAKTEDYHAKHKQSRISPSTANPQLKLQQEPEEQRGKKRKGRKEKKKERK